MPTPSSPSADRNSRSHRVGSTPAVCRRPTLRVVVSMDNTLPQVPGNGQPAALGRPYADLLLRPQHERLLQDSGISPEVAQARGYLSADTRGHLSANTKAMLKRCGFSKAQRSFLRSALMIPVHSALTRDIAFYQARPDSPRVTPAGKRIKYETPAGVRMALDAHPMIQDQLCDPSVPLWITEGIRKADAAISRGLCCIALLGVWNWRGTNEHGGKTALPDWEVIALNGRQVFIAYDSDAVTKREVHAAMERLAGFLKTHGARVQFVYLPQSGGGTKVGLDDYLAVGHSVEDLRALAMPDLRRPAPGKPAAQSHDPEPRNGPVGDGRPAQAEVILTPASDIRPERIEWAWQGRIPFGAVTLLVGEPGLGKSTVLVDICARLTRGQLEGDACGRPVGVIVASAEDHRSATIVPRLTAAGADLARAHFIDMNARIGMTGELFYPMICRPSRTGCSAPMPAY